MMNGWMQAFGVGAARHVASRVWPIGALAVFALAPSPLAARQSETERLNSWLEDRFEEQIAFSPYRQTLLGRPSGGMDDFSIEGRDQQLEWLRRTVEELRASFDYEALTAEGRTSFDVWVYQYEQARAARPYWLHQFAFDQFTANHASFPQLLITFHSVSEPSDMENYVQRIGESARAVRQLIEVSREASGRGIRPPGFAFDFVISEAERIIQGVPFDDGPNDNPMWADAQAKIEALLDGGRIDRAGADELRARVRAALIGSWREAYQELIDWQEADRVNVSAELEGAWSLPDGAGYYRERLANQTTTSLAAEEVHQLGLREVGRLRTEMTRVKEEMEFEGSLEELFVRMRTDVDDPRFFFPDTDEGRQAYLDESTRAIQRIEGVLPEYFGLLPRAGIEVRRVEAFREQPGAAQHYMQGTPDGARPGIYYAHLSDMTMMPRPDLEVTAYHEGLPGHHMQISIAQELTGIPTFRTQALFGAYVEGWALYSEWLAIDIPGTYEDPVAHLGRLGSEMWRAVRLVLDSGLHSQQWTLEEAVTYFMENTPVTEGAARAEVMRYLVSPGQASSYKVGMLQIQELRSRAESRLGAEFDIRAFHDIVLGGGALPLEILAERVEAWIEAGGRG